ncbi:MAG TPA: GNAT family N-acetyltransferase [Agitococcus sp.]|nr:GNAT family N-acetyltransferase [Agitococcus sp.]
MFSPPQSLQKIHLVNAFNCDKASLNDWLKRYSLQAQQSGSAKTFVVCDAQKVAAYFSLTLGQIDTFDAPDRVRQGMGQYPIPVIILARLAVDRQYKGLGLGTGLLKEAIKKALIIAEHAGVRALITHPLDEEAKTFYLRFGFVPSPTSQGLLVLLLKDAKRVVT